MQQMLVVLELNRHTLQDAAAFYINFVVVIYQNVADGRILHERFQRPKAEHLIENLLDDAIAFGKGHWNVFLKQQLFYCPADLASQTLLADQPQSCAIE